MATAIQHHDGALRSAVEQHRGKLLKHTGDGVLAVFDDPLAAVHAAVAAQRALRADGRLRARMGLHLGPAEERDGDYFGSTLNRAARIMAAAHGNQVVASLSVVSAVGDAVETADLGQHRLKDLLEPEHLFQVVVDDRGAYGPPNSLDLYDQNLPRQRTRLIGREQDIAKVRSMLEESALVTLTGVGGVGKTRLAVEVATRELDRRDGAVFVELAPIADPALVLNALASALGLVPGQTESDVSPVLRVLAARSMLVVLDNCEHLLDAAADVTEQIMDAAPRSAVLATSREPLGVDGERVWRVPSLTDTTAALELFVDRARAVRPDLELSASATRSAVEICERLDGIPLAIELAAARVTHLSIEEICDRLGERFKLLTGGRRRTQQRHQTLLATLDWSYDLLSEDERTALTRAGVFTGGFTADALASVTSGRLQIDALDVLGALVDKSLVVPEVDHGPHMRYRLLETVRLYAIDHLDDSDLIATRDAHLGWVQSWLDSRPSGGILSGVFERGIEPPLAELENVRAALDWANERGDLRVLGRMAGQASAVYGYHLSDEDFRFLGRLDVEAALEGEDAGLYLLANAVNANAFGDFAGQADLASRASHLLRPGAQRRAAVSLAANALSIFDPERSKEAYRTLVAEADLSDLERVWFTARSADPLLMTGNLEDAARCLEDSRTLSLFPDMDDGWPHLLLGRFDQVRRVLAGLERAPSTVLYGYRVALLSGILAAKEGRFSEARRDLLTAARMIERFPARFADADVINGFAALAYHEGDLERAATLLAVVAQGAAWGRSPGSYALHMAYRRLLRQHLSREAVQAIRADVSGTSLAACIDAEVNRARERD